MNDLQPNEPLSESNLTLQERVIKAARLMTPKERFEVLVSAGIYTPDGKLTEAYAS